MSKAYKQEQLDFALTKGGVKAVYGYDPNQFQWSKDGEWYSCRELFVEDMPSNGNENIFFFSMGGYNTQGVIAFFERVEEKLGLKKQDRCFLTQHPYHPTILLVALSKWWATSLSRQTITLFLRSANDATNEGLDTYATPILDVLKCGDNYFEQLKDFWHLYLEQKFVYSDLLFNFNCHTGVVRLFDYDKYREFVSKHHLFNKKTSRKLKKADRVQNVIYSYDKGHDSYKKDLAEALQDW